MSYRTDIVATAAATPHANFFPFHSSACDTALQLFRTYQNLYDF